jgi:hypothetical protein
MEQMSIVAQTLGVLRENLEGVEITLFCCIVSHARELISFFAQFEHLPYLFFLVLGCFPNKLLVFILHLCAHFFEFCQLLLH